MFVCVGCRLGVAQHSTTTKSLKFISIVQWRLLSLKALAAIHGTTTTKNVFYIRQINDNDRP